MNRTFLQFLTLSLALLLGGMTSLAQARGVYQSPEDFLSEVFEQKVPRAKIIWLTGEKKRQAAELLGHKPDFLRVRYWADDKQSVWILEEIGKTEPITVGFVVRGGKIKLLKVLAFRESRGDEVRHDFFTRQFRDANLKANGQLDRHIDGITGATLSVRALTKLARLSLYLDSLRPSQQLSSRS